MRIISYRARDVKSFGDFFAAIRRCIPEKRAGRGAAARPAPKMPEEKARIRKRDINSFRVRV